MNVRGFHSPQLFLVSRPWRPRLKRATTRTSRTSRREQARPSGRYGLPRVSWSPAPTLDTGFSCSSPTQTCTCLVCSPAHHTHTPLAPGAPDIDALLALDGRPLLGRPVAALAPAPQPGGGGLRPLVRAAAPLPAREQPTAAHGRHPGRGARSGVAARALRGGGQRRRRLATRRLRADRPLGGARAAAGGDGRAHRVRGLAAAQRGAPAPHGARHPRDPVRRAEAGRLVGLRLDLGLPADHGVHVPGARAPPSPSLLPRRSRVPRVPRAACRSLPPSLPPHALP